MKAWMPDHGHGTNPLWVELETTGGSRRRVGPFDLFMMGLWELTFEITHAGNTDEARVAFCIDTESTGVPRDGGVAAVRDSGVEPPECNVTAPTSCTDPDLDYARVQPIIESRCVTCHDGTQGQWPLTTYSHVADWYDDIRARMLDCNMPPWDSGVQMEAGERELILHWIRCGFPP